MSSYSSVLPVNSYSSDWNNQDSYSFAGGSYKYHLTSTQLKHDFVNKLAENNIADTDQIKYIRKNINNTLIISFSDYTLSITTLIEGQKKVIFTKMKGLDIDLNRALGLLA